MVFSFTTRRWIHEYFQMFIIICYWRVFYSSNSIRQDRPVVFCQRCSFLTTLLNFSLINVSTPVPSPFSCFLPLCVVTIVDVPRVRNWTSWCSFLTKGFIDTSCGRWEWVVWRPHNEVRGRWENERRPLGVTGLGYPTLPNWVFPLGGPRSLSHLFLSLI